MNSMRTMKVATLFGMAVVAALAVVALATPVALAACQPVICPAIAKLCPQGQIACRVSPCNCAQVCQPEGVGCNF